MQGYVTPPVAPRIQRLRKKLFATRAQFCFARAQIVTRSYRATEGQHPALRAAQEDPAAYADLVVRVAGYSAYSTQLSRDVQDEIISRTEQAV
jgi:pyruvate-formate lyase